MGAPTRRNNTMPTNRLAPTGCRNCLADGLPHSLYFALFISCRSGLGGDGVLGLLVSGYTGWGGADAVCCSLLVKEGVVAGTCCFTTLGLLP